MSKYYKENRNTKLYEFSKSKTDKSYRINKINKTNALLITFFLLTCVLFVSGCIDQGHDHGHDNAINDTNVTTKSGFEKITITDSLGRTVEVPKNPKRIAISGSGSGRYFGYLKQTDNIVAVDVLESSMQKWDKEDGEIRPYMIANPEIRNNPILGTARGVVDSERLACSIAGYCIYGRVQPRCRKNGRFCTRKNRNSGSCFLFRRLC